MTQELIEAVKAGRKTKYRRSLCQELIDMMSNGKTLDHFCVRNGITSKTASNWKAKYEDFAEACDIGDAARRAWISDFMLLAATKQVDVQPILVNKLFDHIMAKPDSKTTTNINVNLSGGELTSDQRRLRLTELKEKLIESKLDTLTEVLKDDESS